MVGFTGSAGTVGCGATGLAWVWGGRRHLVGASHRLLPSVARAAHADSMGSAPPRLRTEDWRCHRRRKGPLIGCRKLRAIARQPYAPHCCHASAFVAAALRYWRLVACWLLLPAALAPDGAESERVLRRLLLHGRQRCRRRRRHYPQLLLPWNKLLAPCRPGYPLPAVRKQAPTPSSDNGALRRPRCICTRRECNTCRCARCLERTGSACSGSTSLRMWSFPWCHLPKVWDRVLDELQKRLGPMC